MCIIRYEFKGEEVILPISASTRVGRHWSNDIQLDDPNIPMYWLEIRWTGSAWRWRALSAEDRTRGTGSAVDTIWRRWSKNGSIRLDGLESDIFQGITCIQDQEPTLMLEDLLSGKRYLGEKALKYIEIWGKGQIIPIDDTERANFLKDGDVFLSRERVFRLHCIQDALVTNMPSFDIVSPEVFLEIDLQNRKATFVHRYQQAVVYGVAVLTLATYAEAVLDDMPWIGTMEAFENWQELGGPQRSTMDRLGWERGRIRNQLSKQGCFGLEELFKSRRGEVSYEMRLCFSKEQISFIEADIQS